jgi:hypothetical protein
VQEREKERERERERRRGRGNRVKKYNFIVFDLLTVNNYSVHMTSYLNFSPHQIPSHMYVHTHTHTHTHTLILTHMSTPYSFT